MATTTQSVTMPRPMKYSGLHISFVLASARTMARAIHACRLHCACWHTDTFDNFGCMCM